MNRFLLILPMLGLLAACDPMQDQQLVGTAGGAAIGALITPNDPLQGAVIGGAVGYVAGTYLGRTAAGECVYQRPDGSRYVGRCP